MQHGRRFRFHSLAASVAIIPLLSSPALAGAPYVTDDPEPTPYRSYEILLASDYARSGDSVNITIPHLDFNYGLLPNVQVTTTLPLAASQFAHGRMQFGYGDTQFEIKARVIQETDHFPQISIAPTISVPTGNANKNLGGGYERVFYPVWLEKGFGKITVYGGGGLWHNPGDGNKDFSFTGLTVIRDMGHGLTLGTELFAQSADTVGGANTVGFNFGANRQLDEHHEFLFSVGRSLHGPNTFSAYAAFGWMLGPRDKPDAGAASDSGDKPASGDKAASEEKSASAEVQPATSHKP